MKSLQIAAFVSWVAVSWVSPGATAVGSDFGLYGTPEMLNLSQPNPAAAGYGVGATPASYPAGRVAPPAQTVPAVRYVGAPLPQYANPLVPAAPAGRYAGASVEQAPPLTPFPSPLEAPGESPQVFGYAPDGAGYPEVHGYYGQAVAGECGGCGVPGCQGGGIGQAVGGFEQAACGGYGCGVGVCCPWYASVSALVMGRNDANRLWTTYEWQNDPNQEEHTQFALRWRWGGEIRVGRRFCGDTWAVEATYWTLDSFEGSRSRSHPNGVATPLTVGNVFFGGYPGTEWFDGALEHRLYRRNEFHNAEVNFIRHRIFSTSELPWNLDCSLGARYFRFEEHLLFSSLANPSRMTDPTLNREAFLEDRVVNNLIGFQFGFDADYYIGPQWRVFAAPKFGVYNNHIEHRFHAHLGDGTAATQYEYPGRTYPVYSATDALSFLTQLDVGLEWKFLQNWSARVGYRVVVATGIALADNQIPHFIVDIPEIAAIDRNGELVLHGAFAGVAYNF